jgi:hypothetical protein
MEGAIGHLPPNVPPIAHELITHMIASTKAFQTLVHGDTTKALTQFQALPDSACRDGLRVRHGCLGARRLRAATVRHRSPSRLEPARGGTETLKLR